MKNRKGLVLVLLVALLCNIFVPVYTYAKQNTNEQETITIDIKEIPETKIIDKALKEGQCEVSNVEKILEKILKKI